MTNYASPIVLEASILVLIESAAVWRFCWALQRFHFWCLQSNRAQRGFSSRTGVPGKSCLLGWKTGVPGKLACWGGRTGVPGKLACWGGRKAALRSPVLFRVEVKML